jgi:hypothetical protein
MKPKTVPLPVTLAVAASLVPQVPPPVPASLKTVLCPSHTWFIPVIAGGAGFTVTVTLLKQPVVSEYVITAVPDEAPVTTPPDGPTVATIGLPLVHEPPDTESARVIAAPAQTTIGPEMPEGNGFTVSGLVAMQVEPSEKVMVVTPAATPVTIPADPTVAIPVLLLLHIPPPASLKVVVEPIHTCVTPVIGEGDEFTDKVVCMAQPVVNV